MYYILKTDGSLSGISSSFSEGENYTTIAPPDNVDNPKFINGAWVDYAVPPKLTPIEFKLCFTSQERIAINTLKATDPIVADAYSILDDVRLQAVDLSLQSNINLIDYLVSVKAITAARAVIIKTGVPA